MKLKKNMIGLISILSLTLCACQQATSSSEQDLLCSIKPQTDEYLAAQKNSIAVSGSASAWRGTRDRVFVLGNNSGGLLGIPGGSQSITEPTIVLGAHAIKLAVGGVAGSKFLAYTGCGLQGWGALRFGNISNATSPTEISLNGKQFHDMSVGGYHQLIADVRGQLYAWGRNYEGQLGIGNTSDYLYIPEEVKFPDNPDKVAYTKEISAGGRHSMALVELTNGYEALFTWGLNQYGSLGLGNESDRNIPTQVTFPADVKFVQISAGGDHSLALGTDGHIYSWGFNRHGQLGLGDESDRNIPTHVPFPAGIPTNFKFVRISAGRLHSVALGSDGYLYAWGFNRYGQLGLGDQRDRNIPTRVAFPAGVSNNFRFLVGVSGSAADHTLAKGNNGHIYGWGDNFYQQLGPTVNSRREVPVPIQLQ